MIIDFSNKIVVITGAASGIGLITAKMLIAEGATVFMIDNNPEGAKIAAGLGEKVYFYHADVANKNAVKNVFANIQKTVSHIDILVNNAGIQTYGKVTTLEEEDWDRTMNVNVKSIFLCSKYGIPLMNESKAPVIVNVASVKSFVCQDNEVAYVASKSAILGLTQSIAVDYAPKIRCVAVCPGAVRTPLLTNEFEKAEPEQQQQLIKETESIHLLNRIAEPVEVARFILFLASDLASFATGHAYRIDGGIGVRIPGT